MGAGREGGSPSTAMASLSKQAASTLIHKLQREELLDGSGNAPMDLSSSKQNPNPTTRTRTPRAGNTPIQSPRSMSPLRSLSSTEMVSSEIASATLVDFQEAILRASHAQKTMPMIENYSFHGESMDLQKQKMPFPRPSKPIGGEENEASPVLAAGVTRSKTDILHPQGPQQPRHKSPFPPGRVRSSDDTEGEAALAIRGTKRVDTTQPSEGVPLGRRKSPRRSKVSSSSVAIRDESLELPVERKSSRSSSRRSKVESPEDPPDADLGMGDANRATRKSHARPHTRQSKRKASESITVAMSPPESYAAHQSPPLHQHQQVAPEYHQHPYRVEHNAMATSFQSTSSRRASREARTIGSSDWLQFIGDIIMWRHIPRSALLFGAGCFCITSASLVQDMQYSIISIMAYIALFYLAARFIKCNFPRGSATQTVSVGVLTEADVLSLIRYVLPPFNKMLQKLGDLFCGEPIVTMKVAGALWFLARAGSMMNMWTLTRIAFFALFTVPKCYSCYNAQIKVQARNVLHWMRTTWSACGHKKAVMFTGVAIAWNFSSVSTRVCGAFLVLVGVRAYRHVIRSEMEIGSSFLNPDRPVRISH